MVNTELIIDIIKLYKKYGNNTFEELIAYIKKTENINDIIFLLEKTSEIGNRSVSSKKSAPAKTQPPKNLNILKESDPEKFRLLNDFYQKLLSKQIFSTLNEIKFFREDNGLAPIKSKSHSEAIKSLINDLSNYPIERLKKLETLLIEENRGLQGWSDIILNKK